MQDDAEGVVFSTSIALFAEDKIRILRSHVGSSRAFPFYVGKWEMAQEGSYSQEVNAVENCKSFEKVGK